MGSRGDVESSTCIGKLDFASLTSIFINPLLQRNKMALELMRDLGEKKQAEPLLQCTMPARSAWSWYRHTAISKCEWFGLGI